MGGMGGRVPGRPKKKGIKAALGASAGSKRKLSRMGKKQKKDHAGLAATFIGRSRCLKLLQITLKDFRRLCILKGIYPREPLGRVPGKKKGQSFYHIKDIKAIAHEPVLEKFRDFQAFMKKVKRAAGRNDKEEALRKNSLLPTYTLHHLVKERYPRFQDALADLDDALTLTYLFAALPGQGAISSKVTAKAQSLAAAWGAYCATTSSLTKSFISVKGVYLEASVQNVPIRWVVPHSFTQWMPENVDYRVMKSFFEFYETLLSFVLFKLYSDIGVRYPLPTHATVGDKAVGGTTAALTANLKALKQALSSSQGNVSAIVSDALTKTSTPEQPKTTGKEVVRSVGAALNSLEAEHSDDEGEADEEDDNVDLAGPLKAALDSLAEDQARASLPGAKDQLSDDAIKRKRLFEGLVFFFSREIPRGYLDLLCLSYGGKVGWEGEGSPIAMKDSRITHHIVDRPRLVQSYDSLPKSREYVQPQWLLDCANFMFVLPVAKYGVGEPLPPHLSPWVDDEEEGYKPAYAEEIARIKNGETIEETEAMADEQDGDEESVEEMEVEDEDDDEEAEEEEEPVAPTEQEKKKKKKKKKRKTASADEEAHELARSMMSRKAAHLYGRMQHGLAQKNQKAEVLINRRKEIDSKEIDGKEKDKLGKTVLKQKVERLKSERKVILDTYAAAGGSMKKKKRTGGKS